MKKIIYPNNLLKNDYIGITATSSGISNEEDKIRLKKTINNLNKLGFRVKITNNVLTNNKFVSSNAKTRATEFLKLWQDNKIKVISQVKGGEFLMEILPFLNDDIIKNNKPKWITGYSDASLLNFYITTKFNIATLTSPNILQFSMDKLHKSLLSKINILEGKEFIQENFLKYESKKSKIKEYYNLDKKVKYKSLYKLNNITINGRIIGGCIEAITEIIINNQKEGIVWYLDIFDSNPLNLYRLLWQMKQANWFKNISGVIIGRTRAKKKILDYTYLDCLHNIFDDMNIPVIYDVDIGHLMPSLSIINGSYITFSYNHGKGILKQDKI